MNSNVQSPVRLAINAIPIRPGGGLTVLLGLLQGLRQQHACQRIEVYTHADDTSQAVRESGLADDVHAPLEGSTGPQVFLWQNTKFGRQLRRRETNVLLTFNHYLRNIPCPQVIYHLNLRRFSRKFRDRRFASVLQEAVRDWSARAALVHGEANVFESEFLHRSAVHATGVTPRGGEVVYIGLPNELVDGAAAASGGFANEPRLIAITSPHPHKDNATLLRTLARLCAMRPDVPWHLDIAGGHHRSVWAAYESLAERLGVSNRITWHGFCDHQQLDMLLRQSLCLVATSALESFAMVPLEAMARCCPPIVTNVAAMPESVGDAGIIVPAHNPTAFANAVISLYDDPAFRARMVNAGLQHIQRFRWSSCGAQFQQIFRKLCA
ncbi:MAG: glycosyltransferase family 4 protein [Pirellulaceae bacterium]|nr:glycosyltransferase family 4 protein [Planctomycetales bacterium]